MSLHALARSLSAQSLETFARNNQGNADRFASRYVDRVLYHTRASARSEAWFVLQPDSRWREDKTAEVYRMCTDLLEEMRHRASQLVHSEDPADHEQGEALAAWYNRCVNVDPTLMARDGAQKYAMVADPVTDFDVQPDVITAGDQLLLLNPNGTVTAREITPEDMITLSAGVPYEPNILNNTPELVKQFIGQFFPGEDEERRLSLLFKLLGAQLVSGNPGRMFIMIVGKSTSGKGQFIEAVARALGSYGRQAPNSLFHGNFSDKPRPDIMSIAPTRLAFLSEAGASWRLHQNMVKSLTGDISIPARKMHSDILEEVLIKFTPVLTTNELPVIEGFDEATHRRLRIVTFNHPIPKEREDQDVKVRFLQDDDVIKWFLARLIQGWSEAQTQGLDDAREAFKLSDDDAARSMSHVTDFIQDASDDDIIEVHKLEGIDDAQYGGKSHYVSIGRLFELYGEWVRASSRVNQSSKLSKKEFNRFLEEKLHWEKVKSGDWKWRGVILKGYANWTPH